MNKSKYIILSIICLLGLSACSNEDPNIFDKSSAQRLNEAVKNYNTLLCSSEDGWAMEYFPNPDEQGYTFLMKFNKSTAVEIAAQNKWTNNKMVTESSFFEVIADNGPVLTFNTYNSIFHFFSTPEDLPGTDENEDGRGFFGDYEFIVMKTDDNTVTLKGKKRGLDIFLHRLPVGQDWAGYFAELAAIDKSLFSSKISTLILNAGGEKYTITNSANHIMHIVPEGGDAISQTTKVPFIVTKTGIRFVEPFKGDNEAFSVQSFAIAEDGSLKSTDDNASTIAAPVPSELIKLENYAWRIDKASYGGKFVDAYNKVVTESKTELGTVFTYFQFKYDPISKNYCLGFKNGKYTGMIYIDIATGSNTSVSFSSEYLGDNNGTIHLDRAPAYKEFVDLLCSSEFTVISDSAISPSKLTFTSKTNPIDSFVATVQ